MRAEAAPEIEEVRLQVPSASQVPAEATEQSEILLQVEQTKP